MMFSMWKNIHRGIAVGKGFVILLIYFYMLVFKLRILCTIEVGSHCENVTQGNINEIAVATKLHLKLAEVGEDRP